jgi:phosphoglycerate dehydrogenase-like enzyme
MSRPIVLILPEGSLYRDLFPPPVRDALAAFAEIRESPAGDGKWSPERLRAALADVDAVITGWGSPRLDAAALDAAPRLKIVGHAAGTIKSIGSREIFDRGIALVNAHDAIAPYVGEMALALALAGLRSLPQHDRAMRRDRSWGARGSTPETLFGRRVGLVGLGATARAFLRVLAPFDCRISAADPNVPQESAPVGVTLLPLGELLKNSDVLSLHAAGLPETRYLIGRRELALLPDGALIVNTARGSLIDPDALLEELQSGRLRAALDVTEPEPLPPDHPFRDLPNVFLTPHISGPTPGRRWEMGMLIVEDLRRFFSGEPLQHPAQPKGLQME